MNLYFNTKLVGSTIHENSKDTFYPVVMPKNHHFDKQVLPFKILKSVLISYSKLKFKKCVFNIELINTDDNKIKSFSDIPLTDFTTTKGCNAEDSQPSDIVGKSSDPKNGKLFVKYGTHFQTMINRVKERENELIQCLYKLFDFNLDPNKKIPIKIKGDLTENKLDNEVRPQIFKIIKKMYIECERDFQEGIKIYNEIYKHRNPIQDRP